MENKTQVTVAEMEKELGRLESTISSKMIQTNPVLRKSMQAKIDALKKQISQAGEPIVDKAAEKKTEKQAERKPAEKAIKKVEPKKEVPKKAEPKKAEKATEKKTAAAKPAKKEGNAERIKIITLYKKGKTPKEIEEATGSKRSAIADTIYKYNVMSPYFAGKTAKQISEKLGYGIANVTSHIEKYSEGMWKEICAAVK